MKIYLIKFNSNDYDQYDSFLLVAENEEECIKKLQEKYPAKDSNWDQVDWASGYVITEIKPKDYKKTEIIIDSFNAG